MGLRMKSFNVMGVHWEIQFLGGIHENLTYIGESHKKGELRQFADLKVEGGLCKKEGVVVLRVGWYPNAHYELTTFEQHVCQKGKCTIIGNKQLQKKRTTVLFEQRSSRKNQYNFDSG